MKINKRKSKSKNKISKEEFDKIQQDLYNSEVEVWRDNILNHWGKVRL